MKPEYPAETCDYLIIGGGSAGCVLASRLSESGASVTLVEAGADTGGGHEPPEIRDARFRTMGNPQFFWPDIFVEMTDEGIGPIPYMQARVLGGGSSVNGMHAQRGLPSDYDEWRQLGAQGWGWDDVLPFFKRLETDCDFDADVHGRNGPISIRRIPEQDWSTLSQALGKACTRKGYRHLADLNGELGDGYGAVPMNFVTRSRLSAASAYLTPEVRARPNLRIITNAEVTSLIINDHRAAGATFNSGGQTQSIRSGETIISAGALRSPGLLLRSGVGPAGELQAAGIKPIVDLPGVGSNLNNHTILVIAAHLKRIARARSHVAPPAPMLLRYSSDLPDCPSTDMLVNVWERTPNPLSWDPFAHQMASFFLTINKAFSSGSVRLAADRQLHIRFNLLSDHRDVRRIATGLALMNDLLEDASVAPLINAAFVPAFTPLSAAMMQNSWKAQWLSIAAAIALSGPRGLRNKFLAGAGASLKTLLSNENDLETTLRNSVIGSGHVSGTCRMGDSNQKTTVVDSRCNVVGLDRLRVVDASIFPTLMSAGPNLSVMMAAEKASEMILEDVRA